jgi:hypothetical protein
MNPSHYLGNHWGEIALTGSVEIADRLRHAHLRRRHRCVMSKDSRIAIARNLIRIYRQVLEEPVPAELLDLVRRLEAEEKRQR